MLARHGIRYPGKKDILNGHAVILEMIRHGVSPLIVKRLESVMESFPLSEAADLAKTGAKEQWDLGHRTGKRYASIFHKNTHLRFISSSSARAVSSEKNFEQGLNEGLGWNTSLTYEQRDDLLRFFDICPRYITQVKKNKTAFGEYNKFRNKMFPHIVERIASRLSVKNLSIDHGEFYTVSKKTVENYFCYNFVKFPPTVKIFGRKMAKRISLCEVHSLSTSPNLCRCSTVLNADVPNCYILL